LKIAFIVQGEGRGHLTQAISLQEMLEENGHEIRIVLCGSSPQREIPSFFIKHYENKLQNFISPNLLKDKKSKSILFLKSLFYNLFRIPLYLKQIRIINKAIKMEDVDLVINFHEVLCGFWYLVYRPTPPIISVAHQYIYPHYRFYYPDNISRFKRFSLEMVNLFSTFGSKKHLAINFIQWENLSPDKLFVIPPLLRKEIKQLKPTNQGHILVYLLNPGYAEDIIQWHQNNTDQMIHCFWDKKDAEEEFQYSQKLVFHKINAEKYIHYLATCKGLATTAGYEAICEAMYLGKAVLMVPVKNHPEQYINAVEAKAAGAGIMSDFFDLHELNHFIDNYQPLPAFKTWVDYSNEIVIKEIESI
jgi:uncharacterized protein (TIGR00661 family)